MPAPASTTTLAATLLALSAASALAQDKPATVPYGPQLEGFTYPHPIQRLELTSQGQPLSMAYMDVPAKGTANGRTVVLLHGKNFCGATWEATIATLSEAGYRVIAPDQIGFCASSKPERYQFSFNQLAANSRALLDKLGIARATIVAHSMGGMLATRFAVAYPGMVEQLVLVNPIGLEDWQGAGVPYQSVDAAYQGELKTSFDSIKAYQLKFYYNGQWKPEYDRWVAMQAGMYAGPGKEKVAWNQALTSDMVFTQPVVQDFTRVSMPTVLMIGGLDRTAPGANRATPEIARTLGNYPELGRKAAAAIPKATLVEFPKLGHSPQVEAPAEFHAALLRELAKAPRAD